VESEDSLPFIYSVTSVSLYLTELNIKEYNASLVFSEVIWRGGISALHIIWYSFNYVTLYRKEQLEGSNLTENGIMYLYELPRTSACLPIMPIGMIQTVV
jgi:hypothetical protein